MAICKCNNNNNNKNSECNDHKIVWNDSIEPLEDFYCDVNREEAESLLRDRQNGTFLIRPPPPSSSSSNESLLGTMSIVQDARVYHLNVRRRADGRVALGVEKPNEKSFRNLDALIDYYVSNCLVLYSNGNRCDALLIPYFV